MSPIGSVLPFKRSCAVVVGINDYDNGLPKLRTALPDAQRLAALLSSQHGYEVTLLPGKETEVVTSKSILAALQELALGLTEHDRFLFYFAGHGLPPDEETGQHEGRKSGYLVPQNALRHDRSTFLSMDSLYEAIQGIRCRHVLIILDCCFAGTFRWARVRQERHLN